MEELIIVSGLSGSGKSVVLATLEDCGYYCVDNLPFFLIREFLKKIKSYCCCKAAISFDSRNITEDIKSFFDILKKENMNYKLIFLYTSKEALIQRFRETRRRHPLLKKKRTLEEAIQEEERLLEPLAEVADLIIDTTKLYVHDLRQKIEENFCRAKKSLSINLISFGFKHGVPWDTDFVFDARTLPNPHWEPSLRPLTGKDRKIALYLERFPETNELVNDIYAFLKRWLPQLGKQNRYYVTVAVGCTGGRHRSVYLVEKLASKLRENTSYHVWVRHRDLKL